MICVRLEGGLGNQLFQYAAGRALAMKHRTELLLDLSALTRRSRTVTPRQMELRHFRVVGRTASSREAKVLPLLRRVPRLSRWISPWVTHVERSVNYDEAFWTLPDQSYLCGYWQSYRYASGIGKSLLEELVPREPLSSRSLRIAEEISANSSVALHVRRGDYVSLASAAQFHGVLPIRYYIEAIKLVRAAIPSPRFFVFSDDQDWCKAQLPLGAAEVVHVEHNTGSNSWQDFVLMSLCRHNIIANSSFSWWGAWLADQRWAGSSRQVIAPLRWFSEGESNTRDRFPSHWHKVG